ncbi:MAG: ABC transporter permease, partial [Clostridiales bacterium]|nr:ABC transporter permease [Clostridiales bacterium]
MFKHIYSYQLKAQIRNKESVFWLLMFPIILVTLFQFVLSDIMSGENFETIAIAVVISNELEQDIIFTEVLEDVSVFDDEYKKDALFSATYTDLEEAKQLLNKNQISGYIYHDGSLHMVVIDNGYDQTIIKAFLDLFIQRQASFSTILPTIDVEKIDELIALSSEEKNFLKEIRLNNEEPNLTVVFFYTALAMSCIYGAMAGSDNVMKIQADLSPMAAKMNVVPMPKMKAFLAYTAASATIQIFNILVLLAYCMFVLGVDFGNDYYHIIFICVVGSITGITMGTFISAIFKLSEGVKTGIIIGFTMLCSYLAGMMDISMKYFMQENHPILDKLNPVSVITDSFYALYYYDTFDRYWFNINILVIMSLIL